MLALDRPTGFATTDIWQGEHGLFVRRQPALPVGFSEVQIHDGSIKMKVGDFMVPIASTSVHEATSHTVAKPRNGCRTPLVLALI